MRWYQMPLLIFVLAFALGGSFAVTYFKPFDNSGTVQPAEKCYNAEYSQDSKFNDRETFWEKSRCDPTAYFTFWLAGFTFVLAVSTIGLWLATQSILREASLTSQKQLRAYVGISEINVTQLDGFEFQILVGFKNSGQTPAYGVKLSIEAATYENAKGTNFAFPKPPQNVSQ